MVLFSMFYYLGNELISVYMYKIFDLTFVRPFQLYVLTSILLAEYIQNYWKC